MPGPNSTPVAIDKGHVVAGKTALRHAKLHSRQGMGPRDWDNLGSLKQPRKPQIPRTRDED